MADTVSATTGVTDTTAAAAAMKKSMGMNKDDFLKLFIAQLKNQDPLKPTDPEAMLAELAQLSQLEQAYNTNTALQNLLTAQTNGTAMDSVSFIGKNVKANGNAIPFDGTSTASMQFGFTVPTDSSTIEIADAKGNIVRTVSLASLKAGETTFSWDGRDNNGLPVPAGAYNFSVYGTSASGTSVAATTYTAGRIDGVTITNGKPMLTIGTALVSLSDVINVKGG
jgi:flagellar basal-body rod modification protein FlgD